MKKIHNFKLPQGFHYGLLLVLSQLLSCSEPSSIGADFFPEESFILEENDALPLVVSTILLDSITSTNPDRLLVGSHEDPDLGWVKSSAFFQLSVDDGQILSTVGNFRYDSIVLALLYDGYFYYDTLQPLTVAVHRLTEELIPPDDEYDFLTTDTFSIDPTPLAVKTFRPRPLGKEEIAIRLDDALGFDFFTKLQEDAAELLVESNFLDYFPGLAILPLSLNSPFVGFNKSVQIRLYLTDLSTLPLEQEIRTFSGEYGNNFNQIITDRASTPLANIDADQPLLSTFTSNVAYLQTGTALMTRIDIPNLRTTLEEQTDVIIAKAELQLRVVDNSQATQEELPPSIDVYWLDDTDEIINTNEDALLILDSEFGRDTYYRLDVTDFIQYQLEAETDEDNGLGISLGRFGDAIDQLKIGNADHPAKMELILFILKLKKN